MQLTFTRWLLVILPLGLLPLLLDAPRALSAAVACLAWLALCIPAWQRHRQLHRGVSRSGGALPVFYASQGGTAQRIAELSAEQLSAGGLSAQALNIADCAVAQLADLRRALFVAATYGEGEPPDQAARFARQLKQRQGALGGLEYALLGLGDRQYRDFCGFARQLEEQLARLGARPLWDRLEADQSDPAVLRQWQQWLASLCGQSDYREWQAPQYLSARLLERRHLNPGSAGEPIYLLRLAVPEGLHWQAGDILEVGPCQPPEMIEDWLRREGLDGEQSVDGQPLREQLARRQLEPRQPGESLPGLLTRLPLLAHRDYSIASLPEDGALELLVRLQRHPDGRPGCASGWLCQYAPPGAPIAVRSRANPAFRLPEDSGPLILIGNGTGLAGLRAHLRERARRGQGGHWLLFGERNQAYDSYLDDELQDWLASGHLTRLDRVYSRDQAEKRYVQHALRDNAEVLRDWLQRGAILLVCGSLAGMGEDVEALLHGLLGEEPLNQLREQGRYRRDLY